MYNLISVIQSPQFLRALFAVILISLLTATLGTFSVFRESTFMVSTLAHGAWMGAALGILIQVSLLPWMDPILTTLIVVSLLGLLLSHWVNMGSPDQNDVVIGVIFGLTMSLAILFSSMLKELASRVLGIIFGDILFLTVTDLAILSTITIIGVFTTVIFYERFLYISFDPEGASAMGLKVRWYNFILLLLTALAIVVLVKTVGAIMVYAMLIIPPATAREISRNPYEVATKSFVLSLVSGTSGLILSIMINAAPSALMGLISVLLYTIYRGKASRT